MSGVAAVSEVASWEPVAEGFNSLMILRCLRLRRDRRPLPSSLTVYCLCPRTSAIVPDLSHFNETWFCTHTRAPVLIGGSVLCAPLLLTTFSCASASLTSLSLAGSSSSCNSPCNAAYELAPHLAVVCLLLTVQVTC